MIQTKLTMSQRKNRVWNFALFASIVLLWEIASRNNWLDPLFFGRPSDIIREGYGMLNTGSIWIHLERSAIAFLLGLALAVTVGTVIGLLIGTTPKLKNILKSYIYGLNSLPFVVLLPIIIIWFGANVFSEIFVIFIMASLPIIINTMESTDTIDPKLIKMAESFKADKVFLLKELYFYHSLPYTFSGIRLGIGKALVGLIIAELYGLGRGVGYLISYYGNTLQINKLFFIILIILLVNSLLIRLLTVVEEMLKGRYSL